MIENINWYPGHMKKTRELIAENLKMVDLVIEVIDARIPISSRNPIIDELVSGKKRIIVLNKSDLSDRIENEKWAAYFEGEGNGCHYELYDRKRRQPPVQSSGARAGCEK